VGSTIACVLPHGVVFRGASEDEIRKYLIKELNCIDAVIDLKIVSETLKAIAADLKTTNDDIAAFCVELNIPTPF
jgi:hypothetical protein